VVRCEAENKKRSKVLELGSKGTVVHVKVGKRRTPARSGKNLKT